MQIQAYQHIAQSINPAAAEQLPFKKIPEIFAFVLDAIAVACEQGRLTTDGWVKQCFASKNVFDDFLEQLSYYDEFWRIQDRWYAALSEIAGNAEEYGFITTEDIAHMLESQAVETGQVKT